MAQPQVRVPPFGLRKWGRQLTTMGLQAKIRGAPDSGSPCWGGASTCCAPRTPVYPAGPNSL